MNFGDIKPLAGEKSPANLANKETKAKLQEEGLRQAARFQETQVSLSTSQSKSEIGIKILSASLNQTVSIGQSKLNFDAPVKKKDSLFDFEEVAKNVLNFVGGAIKAAKQGGADDATLTDMFEQASSGVLKGVELARKDLAGFMNPEIEEGINNSLDLIQRGIDDLKSEIFGTGESVESVGLSASYTRESSGHIEIFTKDGDRVTIGFNETQQIALNQQLLSSSESNNANRPNDAEKESNDEGDNEKGEANKTEAFHESLSFFERRGLSFSLEGELDEDEMKAIADLVGDVKGLSDSFFNNDIEGAFNKALELGFDEGELSGYALQLSKVEQVQVIQTYGTVSHFDETQDSHEQVDPVKQIRPVADYLKEMMAVLEESKALLLDDSQYEKLLPGLMNEVLDLSTDDLLKAVNQFNTFNNRLVRNLPEEVQAGLERPETNENEANKETE